LSCAGSRILTDTLPGQPPARRGCLVLFCHARPTVWVFCFVFHTRRSVPGPRMHPCQGAALPPLGQATTPRRRGANPSRSPVFPAQSVSRVLPSKAPSLADPFPPVKPSRSTCVPISALDPPRRPRQYASPPPSPSRRAS